MIEINKLLNSSLVELYLSYLNVERLSKQYDTSEYKFNFKCPLCNEGTSKTKKRGWVYKHRDTWFFNCFNGCDARTFERFVRDVSQSTYSMMLEDMLHGRITEDKYKTFTEKEVKEKAIVKTFGEEILKDCEKIVDLPETHFAKQYVQRRKLPQSFEMYYTNKMYKIMDTLEMEYTIPDRYDYVIVVFRDIDSRINYIQGRDLTGKLASRFKTLKVNKEIESLKVWGMNYIKFKQSKIFITEGAFDAMMIKENALAMGGSSADASEVEKKFCTVTSPFKKSDLTFVFDNEKNESTFRKMISAVKRGYSIVIWDNGIVLKDTNEMICKGMFTTDSLYSFLNSKVYSGRDALSRLMFWKNAYKDLIIKELR